MYYTPLGPQKTWKNIIYNGCNSLITPKIKNEGQVSSHGVEIFTHPSTWMCNYSTSRVCLGVLQPRFGLPTLVFTKVPGYKLPVLTGNCPRASNLGVKTSRKKRKVSCEVKRIC